MRPARLIARLEHAHILPVYDFDGGHEPPYIVMRYLDSGTLKEVLQQGLLPSGEISHLMQQIGAAMDYAHRQGIIHRDLKPSNIMIDREGNAFVTDFGLARMVGNEPSHRQITATGAIMGTPDYMAPEQAMGETIDQRADIYALGVILFEMLTGGLPFVAETIMGLLLKHMQAPIPAATERNPNLPLAVDEVLSKALAKTPSDRYASAAALSEAVTTALGSAASSLAHLRQAAQDSLILRRLKPEAKDDPGPKTPSEQHKTVTVLYADASEYAEIIEEERGPEAVRRAIAQLWETATEITTERGGVVSSRGDDIFLALWGAETAREDDTEQAIRAALKMQAGLREQASDLLAGAADEPLPMNIGLNTGLALIFPGDSGSSYSASGATISLTQRLMQSAYGTILISHDAYSQVRGIFDIEPDSPLKLRRGRDEIPTYRVLAAKPRAFRQHTRGVEGLETRLIGREADLKTLQNAYLDAIEESETQVVTVVSEAGLGKSRLLYEFINWSDLRPELFWVLRGRATPEMTYRPYALLRDLLSFRFEILDNDSPVLVRQKLETGLVAQIGPDEEMAHLLGHLAGFDLTVSPHVKGLLDDPPQLANRAKLLCKRWLVKLCAVNPLVSEVEDLHQADEATLDLLSELVSEQDELPLLLIGLARPTLFERRPTWGSGLPYHTRLELSPLDKRESRNLVREILQNVAEVPKALRDLLVERAEGNPYYLEELVKMLLDERVIIKESAALWRVEAERVGHLTVPTTLVGLLQARLDSLLYPEKLTLQRAAVLGRVFYDRALAALDAADETHLEDLSGILSRLVAQEFISRRETSAFAGSMAYIFDSNLLRDLLLTTLVRRQGETYNRAAAGWLLHISGERGGEYTGLLADYYAKAGDNEIAAHYLQQAGEQALAISALNEARAHFERALHLLEGRDKMHLAPPPQDYFVTPQAIRLKLGETLFLLSNYPTAKMVLEIVLTEARRQNDGPHVADALYWFGQVVEYEGNYAQAQDYLAESLALARKGGDPASLARVLYGLGGLYLRFGDNDQARLYYEESLLLVRRIGDTPQELLNLHMLGMLATNEGKLDEAQRLYETVLARQLQRGDWDRTATLNNLGEIARFRGDLVSAQTYYEQALTLGRELEQGGLPIYLGNLALTYIHLENVPAARQHLHEALLLAHRVGATPEVLYIVHLAGWLLARQGNPQRGLALMGLSLTHPTTDSEAKAEVDFALADLGLDPTDPTVVAQLEAGRSLDLEEVVAELLVTLKEE